MPNYVVLYRKGQNSPKNEPVSFHRIDEELCAMLGEPVDNERWIANWYNVIAGSIAITGHKLDSPELFASLQKFYEIETRPMLHACYLYLRREYTSDAYATIGK